MVDPHWGPVAKKPALDGPRKRWTVRILKVIGLVMALGLVATAAVVFVGYTTTKLPNPNQDFTTATSYVYYGDGKAELGSFAVQNVRFSAATMAFLMESGICLNSSGSRFWTAKLPSSALPSA